MGVFIYDRCETRTAKCLYVLLCILSGLGMGIGLGSAVGELVRSGVLSMGGDLLFYLLVPTVFLQWGVVLLLMFEDRLHWSTGIGWALMAMALFFEVIYIT